MRKFSVIESIIKIAKEAGNEIIEVYKSDDFQVQKKENDTPLTIADKKSSDYIHAALQKIDPNIPIIDEEREQLDYKDRKGLTKYWLVDPIDGTKEFIKKNPILKKIKSGKSVTSLELLKLEKQFATIRPEITIENVQRIQKTDFILFLRKILGVTHDYDPQEMIEREFDKHIIESNKDYNSAQIEFLQLLKKIFARTKKVELKDFTEPPLSNERPLDKFQFSELEKIVTKCGKLRMK